MKIFKYWLPTICYLLVVRANNTTTPPPPPPIVEANCNFTKMCLDANLEIDNNNISNFLLLLLFNKTIKDCTHFIDLEKMGLDTTYTTSSTNWYTQIDAGNILNFLLIGFVVILFIYRYCRYKGVPRLNH